MSDIIGVAWSNWSFKGHRKVLAEDPPTSTSTSNAPSNHLENIVFPVYLRLVLLSKAHWRRGDKIYVHILVIKRVAPCRDHDIGSRGVSYTSVCDI